MANTTIKTKILLRNDTLSNWESSELSLGKGEVAIATLGGSLAEVRVGTGNSTWAQSLKLNVTPDQVSGLANVISDSISGNSKKYQIVSVDTNSWTLQETALSGGEWTDVSTMSVDFSGLNSEISDLTADVAQLKKDVAYLSSEVSSTQEALDGVASTLNTVSSDYVTATGFAALSNEIGLSAASSSNPVVTKDDIADLAGAMHFRGAVTPTVGQTDISAIEDYYDAEGLSVEAGDIVIITTNSKEYVYSGSAWIELGAEDLYETKAHAEETYATKTEASALSNEISGLRNEVSTVSVELSTDYVGKINGAVAGLEDIIAETSAAAITSAVASANAYADEAIGNAIDDLSISDYATKTEVSTVSVELTGMVNSTNEALASIAETLGTVSSDYLTSSDKTDLEGAIAETSAAAITSAVTSANAYTDEAITGLNIGNYYTKSETSSANEISVALAGKTKTQVSQSFNGALAQTDLCVIKVTDADLTAYAQALDDGTLNANAVYVFDLSSVNAFGRKVVNAAPGEASTDVATYGQLADAVTALSNAISSGNTEVEEYVDNSISAAISALSVADSGDGFVTAVTQADGKISVEKKELALSDITDADTISSVINLSAYALSVDVDAIVNELSIDTYIKHGEVTQDDLSGTFVWDCGNSAE